MRKRINYNTPHTRAARCQLAVIDSPGRQCARTENHKGPCNVKPDHDTLAVVSLKVLLIKVEK